MSPRVDADNSGLPLHAHQKLFTAQGRRASGEDDVEHQGGALLKGGDLEPDVAELVGQVAG
jgi:hypothetical protein